VRISTDIFQISYSSHYRGHISKEDTHVKNMCDKCLSVNMISEAVITLKCDRHFQISNERGIRER